MTAQHATDTAWSLVLPSALVGCYAVAVLPALPPGGITGRILVIGVILSVGASLLAASLSGSRYAAGKRFRVLVAMSIVVAAVVASLLLADSLLPASLGFTVLIATGWQVGWWSSQDLAAVGGIADAVAGFQVRRRLMRRVLVLLALPVLLLATVHAGGRQAAPALASLAALGGLLILLVVMLAHVRYLELARYWRREGHIAPTGFASRWQRLALGVILLLGIVGGLTVVSPVPGLIGHLGSAVERPAAWVAKPILWLVKQTSIEPHPSTHLVGRGPIPPGSSGLPKIKHKHAPALALDVRAVVFWLVLVVALGLIVSAIHRSHRDRIPFLTALLVPFGWLWRRLRRSLASPLFALVDRLPEPVSATLFRTGRPSRLGLREQVIWYYLSTARRAGRVGLPRWQSATPAEYEAFLAPHLMETQPELAALTSAMVMARYTDHPLGTDAVQRARADAMRLRDSLRSLADFDAPDSATNRTRPNSPGP